MDIVVSCMSYIDFHMPVSKNTFFNFSTTIYYIRLAFEKKRHFLLNIHHFRHIIGV